MDVLCVFYLLFIYLLIFFLFFILHRFFFFFKLTLFFFSSEILHCGTSRWCEPWNHKPRLMSRKTFFTTVFLKGFIYFIWRRTLGQSGLFLCFFFRYRSIAPWDVSVTTWALEPQTKGNVFYGALLRCYGFYICIIFLNRF